jgi:phosphatidate cytidylyltransferase
LNHPEGPVSEPATPARRRWSDVGPRVASGIVLIALTVTALYVGSYLLAAVVGIAYAGAYREWETMLSRGPLSSRSLILVGLVALCGFLYLLLDLWGVLAAIVAACAVAISMGGKELPWRLGGIVLFCLLVVSIMTLRGTGMAGVWASLFLATVVWMTDSAAFFTGRQIGGEKLAPDISPSKTWSGALGGLALGTGAGLIVWHLVTDSPLWIGLALAIAISIVGQLGDLAESAIKRRFRIKDSGDIIPGHGGLMDRMDSLTFGVFLVVLVGAAHAGFGSVAEGLLYW